MSHFPIERQLKPNRLEGNKNEEYHINYARWAIGSLNHPNYRRFINKTLVNWAFFKGNQWIFHEDLSSFFMDESGNMRNRIKMVKNLVRPVVNQYEGNAVRLKYTARAKSSSSFAINRRDKELGRAKFLTRVAGQAEELASIITENMPVGASEFETEQIFENTYQDDLQETMNDIVKWVEKAQDFEDIKIGMTRHLALSGLCLSKGWEQNGEYLFEATHPLFYFWDPSAKRQDLKDSEFMGEWSRMLPPDIFERWQNISDTDKKNIERHVVSSSNTSHTIHHIVNSVVGGHDNRVPIYEVYWKDVETQEFGWVKDPYGYPIFTQINGENTDFTDADLIDPPSDILAKQTGGKKKAKIDGDILRYAIFIPKEIMQQGSSAKGSVGDIMLEHGVLKYQEENIFDPSSVEFPYKARTWAYDMGEILSPIDDMIDPQRLINRFLSVTENQINNSRGAGTIIDKSAAAGMDGGESELLRNMNESKPIIIDAARVGGVPQAVGKYDTTVGQGTTGMFGIIKEIQQGISDVTGVNEAMTGTQGGSDQLVGVIESQIQRGTLVQEPFYYALTKNLEDMYISIASVGRRIYADNPRRLAEIVGDKGVNVIELAQNLPLETFRLFFERSESEASQVNDGNNLLLTLLQSGLIDNPTFSNLFNRASVENVADGLRKFQSELLEAQRLAQQREQQLAEQAPAVAQQQADETAAVQQEVNIREDEVRGQEHGNEMEKIITRGELQTDSKIKTQEAKDRSARP